MPETVPVQCPECGERVEATPGEKSRCPMCGTAVSAAGGEAGSYYDPAAADLIDAEIADLKATRRTNNMLSFAFAVPGLLATFSSGIVAREMNLPRDQAGAIGGVVAIGGTLLVAVGLCFYARYKGRSPLWGLLGLLSCVGILLLAVLPDYHGKRLAVLEAKAELARGR